MATRVSHSIIVLYIMLLCITSISAFNITRLLNNHPEFSTFNNLLTQTGLAAEINKHRTITILVVDNSAMGAISGKPQSTIKNILGTHVLLDYFDQSKFGEMSKKGSQVTTMFQQTGLASNMQGNININSTDGGVVFGSAVKGAPQDSKMVKSVAAQAYNISVIQISQPIVAPGLDSAPITPSASPTAAPPIATATPPPKNSEASAPTAEAPADDGVAADGPDSEGPAAASGPSPGLAPEADEADKEAPAEKTPTPTKNDAAQSSIGVAVVATSLGVLVLSL